MKGPVEVKLRVEWDDSSMLDAKKALDYASVKVGMPGSAAILLRAAANLKKWGDQDYETVALAIAEEAGEVAQAVLQHRHESGAEARIREEAIDLGALCLQMIRLHDRRTGR